jgi:FixJ family two-component response regulator
MMKSEESGIRRVVIVEDDLGTQKALDRVLRASGFETEVFDSAEAFLASIPRVRPLCLVLDVHLGGMSGLELQRLLRAGGSTLPIVIMTAFDEPQLQEEARRDGCTAYLPKESDAKELLDILEALTTG